MNARLNLVSAFSIGTGAGRAGRHPLKVALLATFACALLLSGCSKRPGPLLINDWPADDYTDNDLPVDPSSFDYGPIGNNLQVDHTFVMTNAGNVAATAMAGSLKGSAFSFKGGSYPGASGNCGATLAPGASCTLVVTYTAPSDSNPSITGALAVTYKAGRTHYSVTRNLTGSQTDNPTLTINDEPGFSVGDSFDYGPVGSGAKHTFYVKNTGATPVNIQVGFQGSSFYGSGGTCDLGLKPLEECTVVVSVQLQSTGVVETGALSVKADDTLSPKSATFSRNLKGAGVTGAVLSVLSAQGEGKRYDYGTAALGSLIDSTFRLTNVGGNDATGLSPAALPAPFFYKGGSYPGQGGTCGASLAQAASCTVVVTFAPTAAGSSSGSLAIGYTDSSSVALTAKLELVGAGTDRALLAVMDRKDGAIDPSPFDYGIASVPLDHTFYVRNVGLQAATSFSAATLFPSFSFKGGSYPGQGGTCGASLAPGAACTLVVTFTPGNEPATTFLGVSYFDGTWTQTAGQVVSGTPTTRAHVIITDCLGCTEAPGWTDFGSSGNVAVYRTLYVTNVGAEAATHLTLAPGSDTFERSSACPSSLAPGESCTIGVTLIPNGWTSDFAIVDSLVLDYMDGDSQLQTSRGLHAATFIEALLTVNDWPSGINADGPFDYGTASSPVDHTFYVINFGGRVATAIGDGSTLGGGFAFKGGAFPGQGGTCGTQLYLGDPCTVVVTFNPGDAASSAGTLTLAYNDGTGPLTATRALTAAAGRAANLTVGDQQGQSGSNPNPFDYGTTGLPTDKTFYVTNFGGQPATSLTAGQFGDGFGFKGGAFPGQGGTCGTSLAPGASCTLVVTFTPSGDGLRYGPLAIFYDDGTSLQVATRPLIGTATSHALVKLYDAAVPEGCIYYCNTGQTRFGTWPVNPSPIPTRTFNLVNIGGQAASLKDSSTGWNHGFPNEFNYAGGVFPGTGASCSGPLDPGASCTLIVQFDPTQAGDFFATLNLSVSDAAGGNMGLMWELWGSAQ